MNPTGEAGPTKGCGADGCRHVEALTFKEAAAASVHMYHTLIAFGSQVVPPLITPQPSPPILGRVSAATSDSHMTEIARFYRSSFVGAFSWLSGSTRFPVRKEERSLYTRISFFIVDSLSPSRSVSLGGLYSRFVRDSHTVAAPPILEPTLPKTLFPLTSVVVELIYISQSD